MTNRGFTTAEMQQHTIRANQAALQPSSQLGSCVATCPVCGSKTRQGVRSGLVHDLCTDRECSWPGGVRLPELQEQIKAEMTGGAL